MSDKNEIQMEEELKGVFAEIRNLPLHADPYLETRVLARLRENKGSNPLKLWKRLAIGSSAFSALVLGILVFSVLRPPAYEAFVNQPFVVRIELKTLDQTNIAKAQIELPSDVYFDIEQYPELKSERTLTLVWTEKEKNGVFPFVLSSTEEGMKSVKVRFLDKKNTLVAERNFNIRLKNSTQKT